MLIKTILTKKENRRQEPTVFKTGIFHFIAFIAATVSSETFLEPNKH